MQTAMQLNYRINDWILHLLWDKHSDVHHYRIMAMSQTFAYYTIDTTIALSYDIPIDKRNSYIKVKIIGESPNNNKLIESNEVDISYSEIEKFKITVLNGFRGTTLAFRSKWVYDLYKVYNRNWLIATTEDPILELLHKITKNEIDEIMVEWYIKKDDDYVLWWVSEGVAKLPDRKKTDYKISVIIPVYNAELFLPRTIDSILSSSMTDIEIVLVDDGSKDDSLNVCQWYAKNFSCVSVIHQTNQWVSVARNTWIKAVSGDYIAFVDSDDIIHPFMYENLYNACKVTKTDIAISTVIIRNDINNTEPCLSMPEKNENYIVYTYDEVIQNMHSKNNMYFVAVWNKIVKAEIIKQVSFPVKYPNSIVLYEDSAYTPTLYSYIDKFTLCKDAIYIWDKRQRKTIGTLSTRHKSEDTDNVWKAFIYAYSYPIYNRNWKNWELCDYASFKRLIESYDKFKDPSPIQTYWNEQLTELINKQKLYENNLIMKEDHLRDIVNKLRNIN